MTASTRNRLAKQLTILLALPAILLPGAALAFLIYQGITAWRWDAITGSGTMETLWPQIAGSMLLMLGACLLSAPLALGVALFHALRAGRRQRALMDGLLHLLQGIPPIVYGLCGLIVLVHQLHWGVSLLTGSIILALIILPLLVLNMVQALERVPTERTVAARSLGLPDSHIVWRVWLPDAWPAILTGLMLAMARTLSETAPILFTATVFSGVVWPDSVFSPVTSLQTHIFYLAQEGVDPQAQDAAWMSAVILVGLVMGLSLLASALRNLKRTQ